MEKKRLELLLLLIFKHIHAYIYDKNEAVKLVEILSIFTLKKQQQMNIGILKINAK